MTLVKPEEKQHGTFVPPEVEDFGALTDVTEGVGFSGPEDGGSELAEPHHGGVSAAS